MRRSISLYYLLKLLSIVLEICLLWMYIIQGPNTYINMFSVVLGTGLTILIYCILVDAEKSNNHLLMLLSIWTLLFIVTRIITLNYTEFSNELPRCNANVNNINSTLLIIIVGTSVLWVGLRYKLGQCNLRTITPPKHNFKKALKLFWFALASNVLSSLNIPLLSDIAIFLISYFLDLLAISTFMSIYFISLWNNLQTKNKYLFIFSLLSFAILLTFGGSRSGILVLLKIVLYISLAFNNIKIKKKYLMYLGGLLPIMIFIFGYSTYMRQTDSVQLSTGQKIELVKTFFVESDKFLSKEMMSPIFDRIGFLDYACESFVQRENFGEFITVNQELKSIIDNTLTPGFDIFDAARISNTIVNYYEYGASASKTKNLNYGYHSDEFTIYGELCILFGIPIMFIILYIIARFIRNIWLKQIVKPRISSVYILTIILLLFEKLLSSFGLDWMVVDIISFSISYIIFKKIVLSN